MACKTTCAMARTPQAKATMPKAKAPRSDFVSWCWIPMSMMNVWKIIWKVIVARSWSLSRSADGFGPGLIDTSESSLWKVRKAFLLKLCFLLVHPSSSWLFQSLINSKNEKMAEGNKKIEKKSRAKKWRGLSSILSGVFQKDQPLLPSSWDELTFLFLKIQQHTLQCQSEKWRYWKVWCRTRFLLCHRDFPLFLDPD